MPTWVALLRGIAPMHPNQKNEQLRSVAEGLGHQNVRSVISSGNLVFESPASDRAELEDQFEAAWPRELGFESTTILRTSDELATLVELEPFGDREHGPSSYLLVTFAKGRMDPNFSVPHVPSELAACEIIGGTGRELFTVTDTTASGSPNTMGWLEKEFGTQISSRTWLTVHRILKKCRQ